MQIARKNRTTVILSDARNFRTARTACPSDDLAVCGKLYSRVNVPSVSEIDAINSFQCRQAQVHCDSAELDRFHELLEVVFFTGGQFGITFELDEPLPALNLDDHAENCLADLGRFGADGLHQNPVVTVHRDCPG